MIMQDKVVLVTGASEGIGQAIACAFHDSGAKVVAVSRSIETGNTLPQGIITKNCDISSSSQLDDLFAWITAELGALDVVVNNAGIWQKVSDLESVSDQEISDVLMTNLLGTILVTKRSLPLLHKSKSAAIVNIVSKSGIVAQAGQSVYSASKYGVRGFTEVLRADLEQTNIRILAVYQSGTKTEMFKKAGDDFPTEKFTEPRDLANQILNCVQSPDRMWVKELRVDYR